MSPTLGPVKIKEENYFNFKIINYHHQLPLSFVCSVAAVLNKA
jgi:hypothetical protein